MSDLVGRLQELGFSEYEARAYVMLLQRNPLNGYELAKLSGVPRANIYGVLQKLEERGAAVHLDAAGESRVYAPVSPEELLHRLGSSFEKSLSEARQGLQQLGAAAEPEQVWTTQGYAALLEHARALLANARERLLVAVWPQESAALSTDLGEVEAREVEIVTLCLAGCPTECGNCRGFIHRYQVAPEEQNRWLVLAPDEGEILAAEISPAGQATAVRTRQRLLVQLTCWYIRHTIALATLLSSVGNRLDEWLEPESRAALDTLGPQPASGWLEYMRSLVARQPAD